MSSANINATLILGDGNGGRRAVAHYCELITDYYIIVSQLICCLCNSGLFSEETSLPEPDLLLS